MKLRSLYPFSPPTPLPVIPGQGFDRFAPFSAESLFTLQEAAEYLRVTPRTVGKFITDDSRANKLKASWVGRRWIITESNLHAFLVAQEMEFRFAM